MTWRCPRCGRLTTGSVSEGGIRWAICDNCMSQDIIDSLRDQAERRQRRQRRRVQRGAIIAMLMTVAVSLSACTSAPAVVRALARDPSGSCASIATVYGTVIIGRGPSSGGEVMVQGGSCSIRQTTRQEEGRP
jgi:hypothetical protein